MAKVVEGFKFSPRRVRYPVDEWFDGRVWEITAGKDFSVDCHGVAAALYTAARRRGHKCRIEKVDRETMRIQAILDEGGDK